MKLTRSLGAVLVCVFIILTASDKASALTREQLKTTMNVFKKQCMPKTGVTEDQVSGIEQGNFVENHRVMCYITCIYKGLNVVKDNRLSKEMIHRQVDVLYPQDMKEPVKRAVGECMHLQENFSDYCEGIFHATKCLYEKDPPNFVFP